MVTRLLFVVLPLIGRFVAGFFGRFLGSEGTAIMSTGANLILLFGIILVGLIFLYRLSCLKMKKKYRFLLLLIYISIFLSYYVFLYFLRAHLLAYFDLYLSGILSTFLMFAVSSGEVNPHSENIETSSSEATSVGQVPNRNNAGPLNPRLRFYPWGSFPSVPSDLSPLPAGTISSVPSLPYVGSDVEVEQPAHTHLVPEERNQPSNPPGGQPPQVVEQAPADPTPQEVLSRDFQHQIIKNLLSTFTPEREVDDDQVDAIILLKEGIVDRMAQLDPHPFWVEQKDYLVAHGILNREAEYTMETLEKNLYKLTTEGQNCFFFKKLVKEREHFEVYGRFA